MRKISFEIELLAPVIFSLKSIDSVLTASADFFSGNVVRGVLANKYIKNLKLGQNAHLNEDFIELFCSGNIKFLPAYIKKNNLESMVIPKSVLKDKNSDELIDYAFDDHINIGNKVYKNLNGYGFIECNELAKVDINKNIVLHMDRSSAKERISGKSTEGHVFNYEAMNKGQIFRGQIIGENDLLEKLMTNLKLEDNVMEAYFGRSKHTQYGKCKIVFEKVQSLDAELKINADNSVYLRAHTPFIPYDNSVNTVESLQECVDFLNNATNSNEFSLVKNVDDSYKIFAAWQEVDSFVGSWGMKQPRERAIVAGSVFGIEKSNAWTEADKKALQELLVGTGAKRSEEGYGQFRIWEQQALKIKKENIEKQEKYSGKLNQKVINVTHNIIKNRIFEEIRLTANADVAKIARLEDKKHLFSRLENYLNDAKKSGNIKESFHKIIKNNIEDATVAADYLKSMKIEDKSLLEILKGQKDHTFIKKDFTDGNFKDLIAEVNFKMLSAEDDDAFYEYWLWFFRHGRKAPKKGGKINE